MNPMHTYQLDMPHFLATGRKETRCAICEGQHDDPHHLKHRRDCKDRYGNGSLDCPACVYDAKCEAEAQFDAECEAEAEAKARWYAACDQQAEQDARDIAEYGYIDA